MHHGSKDLFFHGLTHVVPVRNTDLFFLGSTAVISSSVQETDRA